MDNSELWVSQLGVTNEVWSREAMQDFGLTPFLGFSPNGRAQLAAALKAARRHKANRLARKARRAARG